MLFRCKWHKSLSNEIPPHEPPLQASSSPIPRIRIWPIVRIILILSTKQWLTLRLTSKFILRQWHSGGGSLKTFMDLVLLKRIQIILLLVERFEILRFPWDFCTRCDTLLLVMTSRDMTLCHGIRHVRSAILDFTTSSGNQNVTQGCGKLSKMITGCKKAPMRQCH